jgi:O-antigen ligase
VAQQFGSPVYDQLGDAAPKRMVDNFWLHLVVELGILGATILAVGILWLAIDIVRRTWRKVLVPAIAGGALAAAGLMVVDSLTEMILEGNTLAFMMWFMLGLASSTVAHATRRPAPAAQPMAGAAAELQPGR